MVINMAEGVPAHVQPLWCWLCRNIDLFVTHNKHFTIKRVKVVFWAVRKDLINVLAMSIITVHLKVFLANKCCELVLLLGFDHFR